MVGIGDGLSKQPEVAYATKYAELDHIARMGLTLSKSCDAFLKIWKTSYRRLPKQQISLIGN